MSKAASSKLKPVIRPQMPSSVEVGELRRSNRSQGAKPEYGELKDEDYRPPSQKVKRENYFDEGTYRWNIFNCLLAKFLVKLLTESGMSQ